MSNSVFCAERKQNNFSTSKNNGLPRGPNKRRYHNISSMLGHRLRCWPNIKPTLAECLAFAGKDHTNCTKPTRDAEPMLVYCWASVADSGPALNQHWLNVLMYIETRSLVLTYLLLFSGDLRNHEDVDSISRTLE